MTEMLNRPYDIAGIISIKRSFPINGPVFWKTSYFADKTSYFVQVKRAIILLAKRAILSLVESRGHPRYRNKTVLLVTCFIVRPNAENFAALTHNPLHATYIATFEEHGVTSKDLALSLSFVCTSFFFAQCSGVSLCIYLNGRIR